MIVQDILTIEQLLCSEENILTRYQPHKPFEWKIDQTILFSYGQEIQQRCREKGPGWQ